MCGIAGRFSPEPISPDRLWSDKADYLLRHRGPDGQGFFADDYCQLVHRRLALIDLTPTGLQPMGNEDQTVQVILNGEIYNFQTLRSQMLQCGHHFRGTSDTEVLVHLYEEYGANMVERLQGMFAFAIYDQRRHQLLLARDRFGIKPLYYAFHADQILFASEMKAILAFPGFKPVLDRQACYDFLGLGYITEPFTGFTNISVLPKGHVLVWNQSGHTLTSYHHLTTQPDNSRSLRETSELVSTLLLESVKSQQVADVPVAALLSGGIDSSLVVAAYRRTTGNPIETFNVRFPDTQYDETPLALAVARHYQTEHHVIDLHEWQAEPDFILRLLGHFDQPFADTSLIPTYLVSKAVREQGIICTLSGDGGDEVFGGYARFWRANQMVRMMHWPNWVQTALALTGRALTSWTRDLGRQLHKAIHLAQAGVQDSATLLAGLSNYVDETQKEELVLRTAREGLLPVQRLFGDYQPKGTRNLETLSQRLTENLFAVGLPSDMLRKVDMMSMLAGIEVRVPLLDENLVQLGLTLPHVLKTKDGQGKRVLRHLAQEWLPKEVVTHPKHGFGIPIDRMVTPGFHQMLTDLLLSPEARTRSFLSAKVTEGWLRLFKQADSGHYEGAISRGGLYQRIFIILSLECWLRQYQLTW